MGLGCGCPQGAMIPDIPISDCSESMGQIQKVVFQREFSAAGVRNSIADPTKKASWTTLLSATDGTKVVTSPYLSGPTNEPGAVRTFGGGNATVGGIPITIGREPTTFTANIYEAQQITIAALKVMACENIAVWLIDEYGNIGCLADDPKKPAKYMPIPAREMFVGDKKFGGFEEVDGNAISWNFNPNWSDNFVMVKPSDFNALTDLVKAEA